jgi:hypothetical protein
VACIGCGPHRSRSLPGSIRIQKAVRSTCLPHIIQAGESLTPAERWIVGCAGKRVTATGWSIEREADEGAGPGHAAPAVEVTVYTENFQVGENSMTSKDYDGYIDWVSRHEGLLCRLRLDDGAIALHGDGQGRVLISGAWDGPRGPFSVTNALQQRLESVDEFDAGSWGAGGIAALVAPFKRQSEFVIDGGQWSSDDEWAYPAHPGVTGGLVLAESSWELEEGMGFSFSGESGAEILVRIGPRYVICSVSGYEQEHKTLEAVDDKAAVTAFKAAIGAALLH